MNANEIKPKAGDLVRIVNSKWESEIGKEGVIDSGTYGYEDLLMVCLSYSAFRDETGRVSCSGGPVPAVPIEELVHKGEFKDVWFWKWRDRPRAGGGVSYQLSVPVWEWDSVGTRADEIVGKGGRK